jgi:subtilisin-like proprotein convertase family protein
VHPLPRLFRNASRRLAGRRLVAGLAAGFLLPSSWAQIPRRVPVESLDEGVHPYTGVLWNAFGQGSGTVVRHPRTVASAAHVVFDDRAFAPGAAWLGNNRFLARHHAASSPAASPAGKALRGFWNFSAYRGTSSEADFAQDFVAHYAYQDLASGGHAGTWSHDSLSGHPLNQPYSKLLLGYPSTDRYYLNRTGPFTSAFRSSLGRHFWNPQVAVASGMSGGGAFVIHPSSREPLLAGVIVSGHPVDGRLGTGLRALDSAAGTLLGHAAASAGRSNSVTRTAISNRRTRIPDANRNWTVIPLPVSGLPGPVEDAVLNVRIGHPHVGDLDIVLRSPTRRTRTLHARHGGGKVHLSLTDVSVSGSFRGTGGNGTWQLLVRDAAARDTGTVNHVRLTVTGRGPATPRP